MGTEMNCREAYEFAGFSETAIASVEENIANGTVSALLFEDSCHPNAVGYAVIGNVIFERLFRIGAFDDVFVKPGKGLMPLAGDLDYLINGPLWMQKEALKT